MRTHSSCILAVFMGLGLAACDPDIKYPQCEQDTDCKSNANGDPIDEYCVNRQCQECREDAHCDADKTCVNGRCEIKSECPCEAPLQCENNKCVEPECVADEDCPEGKRCDANVCVDAGCTSDVECGGGMQCNEGVCEAAPVSQISDSCRPVNGNGVVALSIVRFEFNKADLTVETRDALEQNAKCLQEAPDLEIVVEGHCDERGTQEYNLALGEQRAEAVISYLRNLGVDTARMRTVSKGKNEPICNAANDQCFSTNRRVEFIQRR